MSRDYAWHDAETATGQPTTQDTALGAGRETGMGVWLHNGRSIKG